MPGFRRAMRDLRMIEGLRLEPRERRCSGGGDEAVEQHGNAMAAGGERGAEDGCKLAAAEDDARSERISVMGLVEGKSGVDRLPLPRHPIIVKASAAPGPALSATAEQRGGKGRRCRRVADTHLAEADEIGARRHGIVAGPDRLDELSFAHRCSLREIA